jgi:hypothetical protein
VEFAYNAQSISLGASGYFAQSRSSFWGDRRILRHNTLKAVKRGTLHDFGLVH